MQPPSTRPAPNRTTNNPLAAIFFLISVPGRQFGAAAIRLWLQLTEKTPALLSFPACPQSPSCAPVAGMPHSIKVAQALK
jgi:hypothetical protein